jgi:uncharacterized protein YjbJ (UPF0337 family)
MSVEDKMKNKLENTKGKAKETVGRLTNDESAEAEGRRDQAASDVKDAGEKVKDAFRK